MNLCISPRAGQTLRRAVCCSRCQRRQIRAGLHFLQVLVWLNYRRYLERERDWERNWLTEIDSEGGRGRDGVTVASGKPDARSSIPVDLSTQDLTPAASAEAVQAPTMTTSLWDIGAGRWGGWEIRPVTGRATASGHEGRGVHGRGARGGGCLARCARAEEEGRLNGDGFHGGDVYTRFCSWRQCWASKCRGL
jgi:hypothetical protein